MQCRVRLLQVHGHILGRNLVDQIHGHSVLGVIHGLIPGPIPGLIRGRTLGHGHTTVATITMEAVTTVAIITTVVTIRTKTTVAHILVTIVRILHHPHTKSRPRQQRLLNRIT